MNKNKSHLWVYVLLAFGVLISGPRFSGAFAIALGIDLISISPLYRDIEINSGWALALFEAIAIAYVASRFRRIQILDEDQSKPLKDRVYVVNFAYWLVVLTGQVFLLLTIPLISTIHLGTQTFKTGDEAASIAEILTWRHIFTNHLAWGWLFLTSAASTLFVFLIGLVMEDFGLLTGKRSNDADANLFNHWNRLRKQVPIVDPHTLAKAAGVTLQEAADYLDSVSPALKPPQTIQERLQSIKEKTTNNGA